VGDIDISREAVSKEIAALQKCEADPRCYYQFEETRALLGALRAALDAAEARDVGVKPLVWVPEDAPCTRFKAEALGGHMMIVELDPDTAPGTYSVGFDLGGLCFKFVLAEYDDFPPKYTAPAKFDGIEAAKAAAQADYEARILSALHPASPLGAVVMRDKAAERVNTDAKMYWENGMASASAALDNSAAAIRALPLPTDAELLAAAAEMILQHVLGEQKEDKEDPLIAGAVIPWLQDLAALAPFTRKGE